jgi:hypothetical protein
MLVTGGLFSKAVEAIPLSGACAVDDLLTRRYQSLFRNYGVGGNDLVLHAKRGIADSMEKDSEFLRADAAHFLLVNLDHMVIRPCTGYIPQAEQNFKAEELFIQRDDMQSRVDKCLEIIFNDLIKKGSRPNSSHDVLRSIEQTWPNLGNLLNWS